MTQRPASAATREFVAAIPDLQAALDEHVRDNDELLPHVFFGDVSRFARDVARVQDEDLARRLADALERMAASPDGDVVNVIHVSFVEYFVWGDDGDQAAYVWLSQFFGPAMLARTEEFREYSARLHTAAAKTSPEDLSSSRTVATRSHGPVFGNVPRRGLTAEDANAVLFPRRHRTVSKDAASEPASQARVRTRQPFEKHTNSRRKRGENEFVLIAMLAFFAALVFLLALIDRIAMPRRSRTILRSAATVAAIAVAFQLGFWPGVVLLLAVVAGVELGRLIRRRVQAGA